LGIVALFVIIFGGLGFYRGLRRMNETWSTYKLTVADDHILKQQSYHPGIRIERAEVTAIWKASTGDIVVKTKDWKKFIAIPRSLNGLQEVEGILSQWKPIKQYPRTKIFLSYSLPFLILLVVVLASRGYLRDHTPNMPAIFIAFLAITVVHLFVLRTLRRFPNLDERSKPKRWQFIFMIISILLFVISMAVFFSLEK
jgi:hypothetical protein